MRKTIIALFALAAVQFSARAVIITIDNTYSQDFNSLAPSGTSSTMPEGWSFSESGANANASYTAGTGISNAGDTYSFGALGSSERALGGLQSGSLIPIIGVMFQNGSLTAINTLEISYIGEQWRLGAIGRQDRLDLQYSLDATSLTTGTWLDLDALDFLAPNTGGTLGALDGNALANRTAITSTISGLSIGSDAGFWLRWTDLNATGADDGLAIDDFSITARGSTTQSSVPDGGSTAILLAIPLFGLWTLRRLNMLPA